MYNIFLPNVYKFKRTFSQPFLLKTNNNSIKVGDFSLKHPSCNPKGDPRNDNETDALPTFLIFKWLISNL